MNDVGWYIAKICCRFGGGKEALNKYLRKRGMTIGKGTKTASRLKTAEPYLITIGNNVTISHDVDFITHDNSVCKLFGVSNDLFGRIIIGDNCFIGAHSVVLYGVTLANNIIVGAGSVVTSSFTESNIIIAGNPARKIGSWDAYKIKIVDNVIYSGGDSYEEKKRKILNSDKLIVR